MKHTRMKSLDPCKSLNELNDCQRIRKGLQRSQTQTRQEYTSSNSTTSLRHLQRIPLKTIMT